MALGLGVTCGAFVVFVLVALFDGVGAYVAVVLVGVLAIMRDMLERVGARRLGLDPRRAYATAPLSESERRMVRLALLACAVGAATAVFAALLEPDLVQVAVVVLVLLAIAVWDVARVLRYGSWLAFTRLSEPRQHAKERDA
jgi:hypothetical protein